MNKNDFVNGCYQDGWQSLDRDTISLRDFVGWKRAKMKNEWERED